MRYTPTLEEQIERAKAADLASAKAFHKDFYGASAGQLAMVGDFDAEEMKALSQELFGDWTAAKPFKRLERKYQDIAAERISLETPDKANANMLLGVNFPMRDDNPDYPALLLANFMTGGGFLNSRLATRIRQKEGLSYGVGSGMSVSAEDEFGHFMGYAIFNPQNADKLEKAFREELDRIVEKGFAPGEVKEATAGWLQRQKLDRSQDQRLVARLASNEYLGRNLAWYGALEKKAAELTPQQIQEAFKRHIKPASITFVQAGDFSGARAKAAAAPEAAAKAPAK